MILLSNGFFMADYLREYLSKDVRAMNIKCAVFIETDPWEVIHVKYILTSDHLPVAFSTVWPEIYLIWLISFVK